MQDFCQPVRARYCCSSVSSTNNRRAVISETGALAALELICSPLKPVLSLPSYGKFAAEWGKGEDLTSTMAWEEIQGKCPPSQSEMEGYIKMKQSNLAYTDIQAFIYTVVKISQKYGLGISQGENSWGGFILLTHCDDRSTNIFLSTFDRSITRTCLSALVHTSTHWAHLPAPRDKLI